MPIRHSAWTLALITSIFPFILNAQSFEDHVAGLDPLYDGRMNWSDLDNDGDLDIIYSGLALGTDEFHTRVYENNGGTFALRTTSLPDLRNGEIALGDFDNDGDPDVLLSGRGATGNISELYENSGAFSFSLKASLPPVSNSTLTWADIDNDEDLDFIIAGTDDNTGGPEPLVTKIFVLRNDAGSFTQLTNTNLPPCSSCAMDWSDANNDGRIDVAITNVPKNNVSRTELYLNNGNNTFTLDERQSLPQVYNGDVRWGDFDRDGNMDLMVSGIRADGTLTTEVYQNNAGKLQWIDDLDLYPAGDNWHRGTRWVDYNNDGLQDIVLSGRGTSVVDTEYILKGYLNMGDSTFEEQEFGLEGLAQCSLDFGDFDNDGDVDIAYMGLTATGAKAGILRNKLRDGSFVPNTKPIPPPIASLSEKFYRNTTRLQWLAGSDAQTPTAALSYNFWLQQGASKSFLPTANRVTGYVTTPNVPNGMAQHILLSHLPEGDFSWAVQSVDGANAGSLFTVAKPFHHLNGPEVVAARIVDATNVKIDWRDNSGIETSYRIERSTSPTSGFATRAILAANTTTYTDNFAFLTETPYYYRIYSVDAVKSSGYDSLMFVVPAKPENVGAREEHAERIVITWDDMSEHETGYVIERRLSTAAAFTIVDTLDTDALEFSDLGLAEGTDYVYRVRAISVYGYSTYSDPFPVTSNFRPRGVNITKAGVEDNTVAFTEQEFAAQFTDQDVTDNFMGIFVAALPTRGTLKTGTTPVMSGQLILRNALSSLVYTPGNDDNGLHTLKFYYSDGKDSSDVAYSVNMNLAAVNDAPAFTIPTKVTLDEDFEPMTITPDIYIPSDEQSQTLSWTITPTTAKDIQVDFNATTGALKLTPVKDASGTWVFTIKANDGQTMDNLHSASVEVIVRSVNDVPSIAAIEDIAVEKAQPVPSVTLVVTDSDSPPESIVLGVTSDNQSIIKDSNLRIEGNILSMTPELKAGKAVITVRATDGISIGTQQFTLEIMTITDVEKFAAAVEVYPNPVQSTLNITVSENFTPPFKIVIRDALGRDVVNVEIRSTKAQIDFDRIKAGVYLLNIVAPGNKVLYQGRIIRN